eukprot:scaffold8178_cov49-Attheya_sp.AAC.6
MSSSVTMTLVKYAGSSRLSGISGMMRDTKEDCVDVFLEARSTTSICRPIRNISRKRTVMCLLTRWNDWSHRNLPYFLCSRCLIVFDNLPTVTLVLHSRYRRGGLFMKETTDSQQQPDRKKIDIIISSAPCLPRSFEDFYCK